MKPGGRVDVVVVCGGRFHDFDYARRELLTALGAWDRVKCRVFEDYSFVESTDALRRADVLVTYTCDVRPTELQQQALVWFVRGGGRWVALHGTNSALDAPAQPGDGQPFRTPGAFPRLAQVLGSQFLAHPPITPYRVEVTDPTHPLVAGIGPFEVDDELYCSALHGPIEVLLHTRFRGACPGFEVEQWVDGDDVRPVLYLKPVGAGTVCYLTLGHCRGPLDMQEFVDEYPRVERGSWEVDEFRTLLGRCLDWGVTGSMPATEPAQEVPA